MFNNHSHPLLYEIQLEQKLRIKTWLIPIFTLVMGSTLYIFLCFLMNLFEAGNYWVVLFSGLVMHAFFILIIHDGAHKSITRTKYDRLIMNIGSGFMLLPIYAEFFHKFHLVHHANTNSEVDPLWSDTKKHLFSHYRFLYLFFSLIPFLFTIYSIFLQQKKIRKENKKVKSPTINYFNLVWATLISIFVIYFIQPNVIFLILTLFSVSIISSLRHWCEHLGYNKELESNTFWFPLGMGIGNHDVHHKAPNISWISLLLGLFRRPKTTSIFRAIYGIMFDKNFKHFIPKSSIIKNKGV